MKQLFIFIALFSFAYANAQSNPFITKNELQKSKDTINTNLATKAPLNNPIFTSIIKLNGGSDTAATQAFVRSNAASVGSVDIIVDTTLTGNGTDVSPAGVNTNYIATRAYAASLVGDATTLNGNAGSYYLDYGNFANTPDLSPYVNKTINNSYTAGAKQTFSANSANAGVSFGGVTANPSSLAAGDFWFRTDENKFHYYDGTTTRSFVTEQLIQALTNKDLSSSTNTFPTAITNSYALNIYKALGSSIKAETIFSIDRITTNAALTSQQIRLIPVWLATAQTITGVRWFQTTIGSYTASSENRVGLYTYAAGTYTLVASSTDDGTIWQTFATNTWGNKDFTTPYAASGGLYFIGLLYNSSAQTTAPAIGAAAATSNAGINNLDFTNSARLFPVVNSRTTLPASTSGTSTNNTQAYAALY